MGVIFIELERVDCEFKSIPAAFTVIDLLARWLGGEWETLVTPYRRHPTMRLDLDEWKRHFEEHDILDGDFDSHSEAFPLCDFSVESSGNNWKYRVGGQGTEEDVERIESCCSPLGFEKNSTEDNDSTPH